MILSWDRMQMIGWGHQAGKTKFGHDQETILSRPEQRPTPFMRGKVKTRFRVVPASISFGGGNGHDSLDGGWGGDQLFGGSGWDMLVGRQGDDLLDGAEGNDQMFASSGEDTLVGGMGSDRLAGHSGNDIIYGGSGDDTLNAGSGDNILFGGQGRDAFVFQSTSRSSTDTVQDFEVGTDLLQMRGVDGRFEALDIRMVSINGTEFTEIAYDGQVIRLADVNSEDIGITDFWFLD